MTSTNRNHTRISRCLLAILLLFLCATAIQAQSKQLLAWKSDLSYLKNLPDSNLEESSGMIEQIRTGLAFWLELHPGSTIQLPEAPPKPWSVQQIQSEISVLSTTVESLLKQDSVRPFELGVTEISVTSELSPLSPVADSIDSTEIERHHDTNVTRAFELLPGVSIDHKPSRNQSGIIIRGFDTRQIGFYLDNIPIYIPYDGYADMGRFLTGNVSEIQVAKGYSSPLQGPNGLGGAVNIVTRQPEKKLEGTLTMGTGSGDMLESGIQIGSRLDKFIFQGGMNWLQTDYYPLAANFVTSSLQPTYERTNSDQRDADFNGRLGFTPNSRDRYIFSFMGQRSEYGAPPYTGTEETPKFWRWPYWDREGYYVNIGKGMGRQSDAQLRLFYDNYSNRLDEFSDVTYSSLDVFTLNRDHSLGASGEYSTRLSRHTLSASFLYKDDTHSQNETDFTRNPSEKPSITHRDQILSFGAQDSIILADKLTATVGFSLDYMNGLKAQDFRESKSGKGSNTVYTYSVLPFECAGATSAGSFPGCISEWAFNPLASISYSIRNGGNLFFSFAQKSHLPTMKDRYDYKNDKATPNPLLQPEHTRNWSIGYAQSLPLKTMFQVDLFRSDVYDAIEKTYVPEPITGLCSKSSLAGYCEKSVNVGKELHQGVEFVLRSSAISHLILDLNYSYLSRSISGPEEMPQVFPTGTPKHKTVGTANLALPREIFLTATARYESGTIGNFTLNTDGTVRKIPVSNFATVDLGGIFPLYAGARLQIGVNNLLDRYYYYREGYPQSGRNWFFNMKYKF
jgi:iron complex outermembrane receptor protein